MQKGLARLEDHFSTTICNIYNSSSSLIPYQTLTLIPDIGYHTTQTSGRDQWQQSPAVWVPASLKLLQ